MRQLFYGLAVLACPIGMGLVMRLMIRGQRGSAPSSHQQQVAQLRAELDQLKAERAESSR